MVEAVENPDLLRKLIAGLLAYFQSQQEVVGRAQGEQLGNMEFAQAVAPYLDRRDRQLIDPAAAHILPVTTAGTKYLPMGLNTRDPLLKQAGSEGYTRDVLPWMHLQGQNQLNAPLGGVYAFGAENAHPALWAHEFRHDSPHLKTQAFKNTELREQVNREEDLFHAKTDFDKEFARKGIGDILYRTTGTARAPEAVDKEMASILDRLLNRHIDELGQ